MTRRTFAGALAGFASAPSPRHCILQTFRFRDSRRLRALRDWIGRNARPELLLEAMVAPHVPELLAVSDRALPFAADRIETLAVGAGRPAAIFEVRRYDGALPDTASLRCAGMNPMFSSRELLVIPFDSLAARDRAWTQFAGAFSDGGNVTGVSLYRAA